MSDTPDSPDASSTAEREPTSNYTPPSFDIAPEDEALAESLVNQDPRELTGPVSSNVSLNIPDVIPREWLSPSVRANVESRLEALPANGRTVAAEQSIIVQELEAYDRAVKVWGGPGPNANAYQLELHLVENEFWDAQRKFADLSNQLQTVTEVRVTFDPTTGEEKEVQTLLLNGDARSAAEYQVEELKRQMRLLGPDGYEREKRLKRAKFEAVQDAKRIQEELEIDREAERRAAEIVRNERIDEKARAHAKFKRTER
jgi:hypothetical protein